MNAQQRKQIQAAINRLQAFTEAEDVTLSPDLAAAAIEFAHGVFEDNAEQEREKFDNMPEGLQSSDKACEMEEAADALENAQSELASAEEELKEKQGEWAEAVAGLVQSAIDEAEAIL